MALPLIAGPGAIGVVIGLSARHHGIEGQIGVALAGLAIGALVWLCLRYGTPLVNRLGPTGIGALTRILGFLILTICRARRPRGARAQVNPGSPDPTG